MNVLHVTSGIDPKSGGPTRSVKGLCRALSQSGVDVSLLVLNGEHEFDNPCGVNVIRRMVPDLAQFDLVHLHGLWNPGLHGVARACRKKGIPYVVSPRGMLDPWALSVKKWKKLLALFLYQRKDLKGAVAFHATAEAEASHIRDSGFCQPCIIAPNAVDIPNEMPRRNPNPNLKTALFLSRLHPGKGLLTLAEAWAAVKPQGWRMVIVGPDSYGHKAEVVKRLDSLGISQDWVFKDAMDDSRKWEAYRSADLLVHPSVSENFGITIAEGLAAGLPVITTKGTPWSELEGVSPSSPSSSPSSSSFTSANGRCGWWIDIGAEPLARALKEAMALTDAERHGMGVRGRKLVEEKYTWDAVVKEMAKGYEKVLGIVDYRDKIHPLES